MDKDIANMFMDMDMDITVVLLALYGYEYGWLVSYLRNNSLCLTFI